MKVCNKLGALTNFHVYISKSKCLSFAESKNAQALDSFVQVEHLGTEESIQENDSETETFDEEDTMVDQSEGDSEVGSEEDNSSVDSDDTISEADSNQADNQETEQTVQKNDPETEKINTFP